MSVTDVNGTLFSAANVTCTRAGLNLQRQPDADIAGIGVTLAFLIPAYASLLFVIVAYFGGLISDELLTTADREFYKVQDRVLLKGTKRWSRWAEGLQAGILSFSDTQLVLGIAMLITGFIEMQSISIYHIQCVTYLSWMSSNVHLTTLTTLREYFQENRLLRYVRIVGMLVLAGLLTAALIPTGSTKAKQILLGNLRKEGGSYGFNAPARCFFVSNQGLAGPTDPDAPWSFIILAISYMWKIGSLFDASRNAFLRYARAFPLGLVERAITRSLGPGASTTIGQKGIAAFLRRQRYNMLLIVYAELVMIFDFAASFAASLYFLILSLAWGTVQILIPRFAFNSSMDYDSDENSWGFGQILPLLLLALPALTILEHFYGHTEEDRDGTLKIRTPKYQPDYYADVEKDVASLHMSKTGFSAVDIKKAGTVSTTYSPVRSGTDPISPASAPITPSHADEAAADAALIGSPLPTASSYAPLSPDDEGAPLDARREISEFFAKGHLGTDERITLHLIFYRSSLFRVGMLCLNVGTVALIVELVALVLSGNSTGLLWEVALGLIVAVPTTVLLVLGCGVVLRSRLFKVHSR